MREIAIKEVAKDLPKSKAKELEKTLNPMIEQLKSMELEFNSISAKEISPVVCSEAKELRLRMVKNRTALDKERKRLKADILLQGNAIQGVYNLYLSVAKPLEDSLKAKEMYYELIEEEKKRDLTENRLQLLRGAGIENEIVGVNLGDLDDESWEAFFNGQKALLNQRLEEERKQREIEEAEQKKNTLYLERRESIIQYSRFPLFRTLTVETSEADFQALKEALRLADEEQKEQKKEYDLYLDRLNEMSEYRACKSFVLIVKGMSHEDYNSVKQVLESELSDIQKEKAESERLVKEEAERKKEAEDLAKAGDNEILTQAVKELSSMIHLLKSDESRNKVLKAIDCLK